MIRELTTLDPYWDFINDVNADPAYSEPMIGTPENMECNLKKAPGRPCPDCGEYGCRSSAFP